MKTMTSRPGQPAQPSMLLDVDLWPSNWGASELRVSKYMADGLPQLSAVFAGTYEDVNQAIRVLRIGYDVAGVKYNMTESIHK